MDKLKRVESVLNEEFECTRSRFVKADYDIDIYSDGYQTDIKATPIELFKVLGSLFEEFNGKIGVETHALDEECIRVFITDE